MRQTLFTFTSAGFDVKAAFAVRERCIWSPPSPQPRAGRRGGPLRSRAGARVRRPRRCAAISPAPLLSRDAPVVVAGDSAARCRRRIGDGEADSGGDRRGRRRRSSGDGRRRLVAGSAASRSWLPVYSFVKVQTSRRRLVYRLPLHRRTTSKPCRRMYATSSSPSSCPRRAAGSLGVESCPRRSSQTSGWTGRTLAHVVTELVSQTRLVEGLGVPNVWHGRHLARVPDELLARRRAERVAGRRHARVPSRGWLSASVVQNVFRRRHLARVPAADRARNAREEACRVGKSTASMSSTRDVSHPEMLPCVASAALELATHRRPPPGAPYNAKGAGRCGTRPRAGPAHFCESSSLLRAASPPRGARLEAAALQLQP